MKITARERRVIAVGAVAVLAVVVYYAMTLLPDREELARTVELKKKMLLKQRETLSREEIYKERLEEYKKHLEQDMTRLLPGDNPNVAAAELQKILKDFADRSSVEITGRNVIAAKKPENGIQKVSVRIDTNCNPEQLVQFLTAVENSERFLTIDELTITSMRVQRRYELRPNLTISGSIAAQETKAAEKTETGV